MKNSLRVFSMAALVLTLSGCGAPSVEELKNDKELFSKTMAECQSMGPVESMEEEACLNVIQAASAHAMGNLNNAMKGLMGN